jgi:circadian clock protein KaiC
MTRVKTGIEELDTMLNGGFLESDAILLAGSAGTGKTILGLQFVVNGVEKYGENGLFVTFEQLPDQIYRDAKNFGWDLRRMEEENRLRIISTSPHLMLKSEAGEHLLDEVIRELHPKRIVIDSVSHLEMFVPKRELRREVYRLVMYLKTKGMTSLLTWEAPQVLGAGLTITEAGISFLVDCIILLRFVEIESSMKKAIAILKMRGSEHDKRLREFEITSSGIKISAPFEKYEQVFTGAPRKAIPVERLIKW